MGLRKFTLDWSFWIWVIFILVTYGTPNDGSKVVKLGKLYEQKGTWLQDGVVLLYYKIPFNGNLFQIKMNIKNNNPVWIQSWRRSQPTVGDQNMTMTNRMRCQSNTGSGIVSFDVLPMIAVTPEDYVGIFIPAGIECPVKYRKLPDVDSISIHGSREYIQPGTDLSIGDTLFIRYIGYPVQHAIEFYFNVTSGITSSTHDTTTPPPSIIVTTTPSITTSQITRTPSPTVTKATTVTDIITNQENTSSGIITWTTPEEGELPRYGRSQETLLYIILPVIAVAIIIVIIVVTAIYKYKTRRRMGKYSETDNAMYGINLPSNNVVPNVEDTGESSGTTYDRESNVYDNLDENDMTIEK